MNQHVNQKKVLELQRSLAGVQQNINRIYNICSALYGEIQDLKRHTNFKPDELSEMNNQGMSQGMGGGMNMGGNQQQGMHPMMGGQGQQMGGNQSVLDSYNDLAQQVQQNRKLKIINN